LIFSAIAKTASAVCNGSFCYLPTISTEEPDDDGNLS